MGIISRIQGASTKAFGRRREPQDSGQEVEISDEKKQYRARFKELVASGLQPSIAIKKIESEQEERKKQSKIKASDAARKKESGIVQKAQMAIQRAGKPGQVYLGAFGYGQKSKRIRLTKAEKRELKKRQKAQPVRYETKTAMDITRSIGSAKLQQPSRGGFAGAFASYESVDFVDKNRNGKKGHDGWDIGAMFR